MVTLGLMADPGLPESVVRSIAGALSDRLSRDGDSWDVDVSRETLPLTQDGTIPLMRDAPQLRDRDDWDYVVYVTDLPLHHDDEPMLCEVDASARAALVSLPALGLIGLRARTRDLILTLVGRLQHGPDAEGAGGGLSGRRAVRRERQSRDGDHWHVVLPGLWNTWRLLLGMIRSNRPGRLLAALSRCIAAALATGAFGIFFASMWNMADSLPVWRLAVITLLAVAVLTGWLIIRNGLWDRTTKGAAARERRDNASTTVTIGLSVAMVYVLLLVVLFVAALIVVDAGYLEAQLQHPVSLLDYARLSWLAASLGTVAGALGSNFDSDDAIREATYSRREHERRQLRHPTSDP